MIENIFTIIIIIGCLVILVYLFKPFIHDAIYSYKYYGDIDMKVDYAREDRNKDTETGEVKINYEITLKYE